jgi:hypothetical protein
MSLNESIVENAALEWFLLRSAPLNYGGQVGELGYAIGHGAAFAGLRRAKPSLAPGEPAAECDSFSEVEQAAKKASRRCQGTTKIKRISI